MTSSTREDDLFTQLLLTEPRIARLTQTAVATALAGFRLDPLRELKWVARAIQGALYTSLRSADESAERPSNADTRDELLKLSTQAAKLWAALVERSDAADSAIWDHAFGRWTGEGGVEVDGISIGEPTEYGKFREAVSHVEALAGLLRRSADELKPQVPNWRRAEQREERIFRAQCLSPIYQSAFGQEPTVNTWPGTKSLGPWPDFYQRIVSMAFGEQATPDLEGVLDEARRRDKMFRVTFAAGVIPD
ncbi:hypothetical protein LZ016_10570 [Sphingomonas sp. SM33]|uniref:Uncharacterized protein n=1 Tax=Sphingomonas telluris TaxID=2907998 RepID=A0ABS9VNJ0_9SPHN|nr:hypothetical protein [Sphingomonas telluris]MCH8616541.1 hypothetical protein [Sphingomonas telluris]